MKAAKRGKAPVAGRHTGQAATTAICLCTEKTAADKDQRKRDTKNQFFAHCFSSGKILVTVSRPEFLYQVQSQISIRTPLRSNLSRKGRDNGSNHNP